MEFHNTCDIYLVHRSYDDPRENGYFILNITYDPYTLQEDVSIDGRIFEMGEHADNTCFLSHLIQGYKWYSDKYVEKTEHVVVEMSTLVHPQLEVDIAKDQSNIRM